MTSTTGAGKDRNDDDSGSVARTGDDTTPLSERVESAMRDHNEAMTEWREADDPERRARISFGFDAELYEEEGIIAPE